MILLSILLAFFFQSGTDAAQLPPLTCEEYHTLAKEARENKNLEFEIQIWEEAINSTCLDSSTAYSQLSLCYLEAGDQSYSDRGSKDVESRKAYFEKALEAANKAIDLDDTNKFGFEHKSMAYAGMVDVYGLKQKVQLADSVRVNAEIALELDPKNDRALHILGRWHYEVSQFGGVMRFFARLFFGTAPKASLDKALDYFQRAVDLDDYPVHHYWLALTHLEMGNKKLAIHHFEYLLSLGDEHHNDEFFKNEAVKKLDKLR